MRLYYMTGLETAEKHILPEWRMKLSTFDKVNDPFELLCADQGDKLQKHILKVLLGHWTNLTVLTKSRHYANFFKQEVSLDGRVTRV